MKCKFSHVDIDFSLALHNRTGKYFIGRDLLDTLDLPVGDVHYWRMKRRRSEFPPSGLLARIIGRLELWQIRSRSLGGAWRWMPRRRPARPLLHLDPFSVPTTRLRPIDAVLCHDIGPVTHPQLFDADVGTIYGYIYTELVTIGPHLIFVSDATRRAFVAHYPGANQEKMRVIYPATRAGITTAADESVPGVDGPFLLTVGSIGDRKNQRRCIEAFAQSGLAARGYRYVLCGAREPGHEVVEAAAAAAVGVILLSYVGDGGLSWLYGNALGFVLVSQLEGFGMPVAEAIARGLVPLITRDSVLDEVAGDGALLADADDVSSITDGMTALVALDDGERKARIAAMQRSIERFDLATIRMAWRTAFDDILADANRR